MRMPLLQNAPFCADTGEPGQCLSFLRPLSLNRLHTAWDLAAEAGWSADLGDERVSGLLANLVISSWVIRGGGRFRVIGRL